MTIDRAEQLLLAERGFQQSLELEWRVGLIRIMNDAEAAVRNVDADGAVVVTAIEGFIKAAAAVLKRERAAIEVDRAVWWRPWLQFKAWLERDRPRFPNLP
jgi:hypothetical protein